MAEPRRAAGALYTEGMPFYAVTYDYSAPESELATRRDSHRGYLAALDELVLSGPWVGGSSGALLIFRAADAERVEAIVAGDPFVQAGYVAHHEIREWRPASGPLTEHL